MRRGRILPLLGPALVLYLVAEAGSSLPAITIASAILLALGVAASLVPLAVWSKERAGVRRTAILGVTAGVLTVRWAAEGAPSVALDIAAALAAAWLGAASFDLALDVPDLPPSLLRRRRGLRTGTYALAAVAATLSALAHAPAPSLLGTEWLLPSAWRFAAPGFALGALAVGLALRVARRRLGSPPEALADGSWAQLGLWGALLALALEAALVLGGIVDVASLLARGLSAAAMLALVAGHLAMLGARRQVHAGRSVRRVLAGALAILGASVTAALLGPSVPAEPIAMALATVLLIVEAAALDRIARIVADRLLAPFGGRLIEGAQEARDANVVATSLAELAEGVLPPLRVASGSVEATPMIFAFDPPRIARIDLAGVGHDDAGELPAAVAQALVAQPGDVLVAAPLIEGVVRRPELRALVDALERLDALCIVPLRSSAELEGALVVPRGRRRGAITLEEIDALERLGRRLASFIAVLGAQERSRVRVRDAVVDKRDVEEKLETAQDELERLRAEARSMRAAVAARAPGPPIAYSPAMRALVKRVAEIAPLEAPVLLVGEEASGLDVVAQLVHAGSGRREHPLIVGDCTSVRPERLEAALFGDLEGQQPGWLRLAETGTCVLVDVPALPLGVQARLAESLATRRAQAALGASAYALGARVVATSRVPLAPLAKLEAFSPELARRFAPLTLSVPPLRERREDVPSLVLLALDRTCRRLGREVVGIEQEALDKLARHHWPGNQQELDSVIDHAVQSASGSKIALADLPPLVPAVEVDPFAGTYAEIERRVLVAALERAGGNKSEAARLLDLKRTTFLDKLKRHELVEAPAAKDKRGAA